MFKDITESKPDILVIFFQSILISIDVDIKRLKEYLIINDEIIRH